MEFCYAMQSFQTCKIKQKNQELFKFFSISAKAWDIFNISVNN